MKLIGRSLSPFVRRVAATLNLYGLPFEQLQLATSTDGAAIAGYNPLGRVPSLVLDTGEVLVDSAAILDHLDEVRAKPASPRARAPTGAWCCTRWPWVSGPWRRPSKPITRRAAAPSNSVGPKERPPYRRRPRAGWRRWRRWPRASISASGA